MTKHFTLNELTRSATAARKGIDNNPDQEAEGNLYSLCENVLEPIRKYLGEPLRVNSGYRSQKLNKAIGGARWSQHLEGEAADITCTGRNAEIVRYALKALDFDQLIWEYGTDEEPQWVHISFRDGGNRKEALRAVRGKWSTKYSALQMENFDDWVNALEEGEQPKACAIDDPDCEACGS